MRASRNFMYRKKIEKNESEKARKQESKKENEREQVVRRDSENVASTVTDRLLTK